MSLPRLNADKNKALFLSAFIGGQCLLVSACTRDGAISAKGQILV
jgi:hypothetical protein